jgi:hypothetical protein
MTAPHTPFSPEGGPGRPTPTPEHRRAPEPVILPSLGEEQTEAQRIAETTAVTEAVQSIINAEAERVPTESKADAIYGKLADRFAQFQAAVPAVPKRDDMLGQYGNIDLARNAHLRANAETIEAKHNVEGARETIETLIETGNTSNVMLVLTTSRDGVRKMRSDDIAAHDKKRASLDDDAAHTTSLAKRLRTMRVGYNKESFESANNDPKYPTDVSWPNSKSAARRDWRNTVQENAEKRWDKKNTHGNPATHLAQWQREDQATEAAVQQLADRMAVSDAMSTLVGAIVDSHEEDIQERLNRLDALTNNLNTAMPGAALDADINEANATRAEGILARLASELEDMSPLDQARAHYMERLVQETYRLQHRIAMNLPQGATTPPRFNPDRSLQVNAQTGPAVLYEDGSLNVDGQRRWPDGSVWHHTDRPSETSEADLDLGVIRNMTDDELRDEHSSAVVGYEFTRTPEDEVYAAVMSREYSGRLDRYAEGSAMQLQAAREGLTTAETDYNTAAANRANEIAQQLAAATPDGATPADVAALRGTVEATVDREIAALRDRRDKLERVVAGARDTARNDRQSANESQYDRLYLAVNRPEEAGVDHDATVRIMPRGEILLRNGTFNGVKGNWVVFKDGSSQLYDARHAIVGRYRADGVPMPAPRP